MARLGQHPQVGERLLQWTAIGLGLKDVNTLTNLTRDDRGSVRVYWRVYPRACCGEDDADDSGVGTTCACCVFQLPR